MVSSPFIRFYAASPIATPDGHVIGALAVFDPEPRFGFALNLRSTLEGLAQKAFDDFMKLSNCPQSMEEAHGRGGGERISSEKDAGPWSSFSEHAKVRSKLLPSNAPHFWSPVALKQQCRRTAATLPAKRLVIGCKVVGATLRIYTTPIPRYPCLLSRRCRSRQTRERRGNSHRRLHTPLSSLIHHLEPPWTNGTR